jgi:MFS family permease
MDDDSEELNKKDDKNIIDNNMSERLLESDENENLNQNSSLSSDSIFPIIYNSYRILLYVLSVIVITNSTTFYFPTLTEYLKNSYGLTVTMSSLFFLGNSVSYLISLQFINQISNYFGNIPIMAISLIFNGFGCLLIPPIGILPFSSIITFIGIFINGFFSSFINVNMFIVSGDELKRMDNRATETQKSDISSALFNASLNIADLIAPILGAYITSKINFGWSAYVSGSFCFILSILFIKEYEKIKKEL